MSALAPSDFTAAMHEGRATPLPTPAQQQAAIEAMPLDRLLEMHRDGSGRALGELLRRGEQIPSYQEGPAWL